MAGARPWKIRMSERTQACHNGSQIGGELRGNSTNEPIRAEISPEIRRTNPFQPDRPLEIRRTNPFRPLALGKRTNEPMMGLGGESTLPLRSSLPEEYLPLGKLSRQHGNNAACN